MQLDFDKMNGLIPAVVQHAHTRQVLMIGYMNDTAWLKTVQSGLVTFYSRSKSRLWTKGESSGHTLRVVEALTDCDQDAVLILAEPRGPGVCHEGYESCFFRKLSAGEWDTTLERSFDPEAVYGSAK